MRYKVVLKEEANNDDIIEVEVIAIGKRDNMDVYKKASERK